MLSNQIKREYPININNMTSEVKNQNCSTQLEVSLQNRRLAGDSRRFPRFLYSTCHTKTQFLLLS